MQVTHLTDYAKSGVCMSRLPKNDFPVVESDGKLWLIKKRLIYPVIEPYIRDDRVVAQVSCNPVSPAVDPNQPAFAYTLNHLDDHPPAGLLFPEVFGKSKDKMTVIRNGDNEAPSSQPWSVQLLVAEDFHYTISPSCIALILDMSAQTQQVCQSLVEGRIRILDFVPDTRLKFTSAERHHFHHYGYSSTQEEHGHKHPGFSVVCEEWHRPGFCLFARKNTTTRYLMGMDNGTYFAVELPEGVEIRTAEQAFKRLEPDEAKGKRYLRQGEWFMISTPGRQVPPIEKCQIAGGRFNDAKLPIQFDLPVGSKDSNIHGVNCVEFRVCDGVIYAHDPHILHDDHPEVTAAGWVRFVRNTAVRSVSVEGVD